MARNRVSVDAPPETVFAVLSDPSTYDGFVVGTKRIRRFEPTWPDVGAEFHHTLGVGPFILRDLTRVVEAENPHRLVLRAQMQPFSVNLVTFTLEPAGAGTRVEVEEHAVEGPAAAVWNRVLDGAMWLRNQEMLRRLRKIAERRRARQAGAERS